MGHSQGAMKNLHAATTVKIPEGVTVDIKSRAVVVKGPRGTLSKSFKHMQIDLFKPKDTENIIKIEKWFSLQRAVCHQDLLQPHPEHDYRCHKGIQIPHEDGLCAFPHQRPDLWRRKVCGHG